MPISWNSTGITVAGVSSSPGVSVNQLTLPYSIAIDSSNSLYMADRLNNRIQKWTYGATSGITIARQANGVSGTGLNYLNQPCDVILDVNNNFYIADTDNHRVLFWSINATTEIMVAGTDMRTN